MGLAESRKRTKIAHDPNNTAWSRKTDAYGHRLMRAHGWQPGQELGLAASRPPCLSSTIQPTSSTSRASTGAIACSGSFDAALQSGGYNATASSKASTVPNAAAAYLRIHLREDNLGLGAKIGRGATADGFDGPTTGLDGLQDLLGRLNGRDAGELAQQRRAREVLRQASWLEGRWGAGRWVDGGQLEGSLTVAMATKSISMAPASDQTEAPGTVHTSAKEEKRRRKELRMLQKRRNRDRSDINVASQETDDTSEVTSLPSRKGQGQTLGDSVDTAPSEPVIAQTRIAKKKRRRGSNPSSEKPATMSGASESQPKSSTVAISQSPSPATTLSSTMVTTAATASGPPGGRHALRQRYIRQKKQCMLDERAMKEILMIKA